MTTMTEQALATQVYQVFIKATPERIWEAITRPEFTIKYFHGARVENTPERHLGLGPKGQVWGDAPTLEWDPPRRLVHGWKSLYEEEMGAEPESRVTWEIEPQDGGLTKVTVVHDRLEASPKTAASVSGAGWMFVLSGLKTVVETGESFV
jgi:uncharacterized protein YndB with AHSA1/START domain